MNLVPTILACAVCFGAPDSAQTQGGNMLIFTLLGVTGVVLGGFLGMVIYLMRRARRYQAAEEIVSQIPKGLPEIG
jgi:heme/copper-type cytochrome/quinol oxidase subunit 2